VDIIIKFASLITNSELTPFIIIVLFFVYKLNMQSEQNKKEKTAEVLQEQIIKALDDLKELNSIIIAYEPIWAIGSGQTPEPHKINSIHEMIKDVVQSRFSNIGLDSVLYGGSVNSGNAAALFEEDEIDGALVGGASLDGKEFAEIANILNDLT